IEQAEHGAVEEQLEVFRRCGFQMFEQVLFHALASWTGSEPPRGSGWVRRRRARDSKGCVPTRYREVVLTRLIEVERDEPACGRNATRITIQSRKANRQGQVRQAKVNVDVRVSGADSRVMTTENHRNLVVRFESESFTETHTHVRHQ